MITTTTRTAAKGATWHIVGFASLAILLYLRTDSWALSASTSVLYALATAALYYAHETAWSRIRWGKLPGLAVQMTGLSGAGKSTIARALKRRLEARGIPVEIVDGDAYRAHLCADLGFSKDHRVENIRRLAFVAHKLSETGRVAIVAAINPYEESRAHLRTLAPRHMTVFIDARLETVVGRDTKGLYKRALLPVDDPEHIARLTGVSDPFEAPQAPDLVVDTSRQSIDQSVSMMERAVLARLRRRQAA